MESFTFLYSQRAAFRESTDISSSKLLLIKPRLCLIVDIIKHCVIIYVMSVVIKTIREKRYAYLAFREGGKVIHKYLGPSDDPATLRLISDKKETEAVPERFRPLFWDTSLSNIQIKRNARYVIERLLEYGDMSAIEWLQRVYSAERIIDVVHLSRAMTERARTFWLNWFGVDNA